MKTIGLIHGMSPVATVDYYQRINGEVNERLGGNETAELIIASVNFAVIARCLRSQAWDEMDEYLTNKAQALERAGADFLAIGSHAAHQSASAIEEGTSIPLLHMGDVIANAAEGALTLGLIGSTPVMEGGFYHTRLESHGKKVIVPSPEDRDWANHIIYEELTKGIFADSTRAEFVRVLRDLMKAGADAIVLGCTEYGLLVNSEDVPDIPLLNATELQVDAIVRATLA